MVYLVMRDHLANAYGLNTWVSEKSDDGYNGSEIGDTTYPASGSLGGGSLRAASNLVYDHKYVYRAAYVYRGPP